MIVLFLAYPAIILGTAVSFWYAGRRCRLGWFVGATDSPMRMLWVGFVVGSAIFAAWPITVMLERSRCRSGAAEPDDPDSCASDD